MHSSLRPYHASRQCLCCSQGFRRKPRVRWEAALRGDNHGVSEGINVGVGGSDKRDAVRVWTICTVAVALAAITTGVAVKMEGVIVGGRNGVGGSAGLNYPAITEPDSRHHKNCRIYFFISSPPYHCIPLYLDEQSPLRLQKLRHLKLPAFTPIFQVLLIFRVIIS